MASGGLQSIDTLEHEVPLRELLAVKLRALLRTIGSQEFAMGEISSLRINQISGLEKLAAHLESDEPLLGYFTQATGAGKTILFCIITRLLDEPTVIFVPRVDLIDQAYDALIRIGFTAEDIGKFGGGTNTIGKKIVVATYQSHISHSQKEGPYREFMKKVRLTICDEAHRSLGEKTVEALDEVGSTDLPTSAQQDTDEENAQDQAMILIERELSDKTLVLGFTATSKLAAKHVKDRFRKEIAHDGVVDMIKAGVLCNFRIEQIRGDINPATDFSNGIITNDREVKILERNKAYDKLLDVFDKVFEQMLAQGQVPRTVASCSNITEANRFLDLVRQRGYQAEVYTSKDKDAPTRKFQAAKKTALESRMRRGQLDMIVTVDKLSEGWDFPEVNIALNARAIASPARIVQFAGRALRIAKDKLFAVIIEVAWQIKGQALERSELDESTEGSGSGGNADEGGAANSINDGDKLGFLEALAELGESIDDLRSMCVRADGTPFEYVFGTNTLRKSPTEVARTIRTEYSVVRWINLTSVERAQVKVFDIGITAIASLFGVDRSPIGSTDAHLALALKIWENDPISCELITAAIAERTVSQDTRQEIIRKAILAKWTARVWVDMSGSDLAKVKVGRDKINAIGTIFGVTGRPDASRLAHLELALKIWENEDAATVDFIRRKLEYLVTAKTELEGLDGQALQKKLGEVIRGVTTIERFLGMTPAERQQWEILGLGMSAVARAFGVQGNPISRTDVKLELVSKIWADDPAALAVIVNERSSLSLVEDPVGLAAAVRKDYTVEQWIKINTCEARRKVCVAGMKIKMIATILGFDQEEDVLSERVFLSVGLKVWPVDPEHAVLCRVLEAIDLLNDPASLRPKIQVVSTPAKWLKMNPEARKKFRVEGLSILNVARIFGLPVEEDPIKYRRAHLVLGLKIWEGKPDQALVIQQALDAWDLQTNPSKIGASLRAAYTFEAWATMSTAEQSMVEVNGWKPRAISKALGVTSESYDTETHMKVGVVVWHDVPEAQELFKTKLKALATLADIALLKADIKAQKTPEQWVAMGTDEIDEFKVQGFGIVAVGTALGIHNKDNKGRKGFLKVGYQVWEDDPVAKEVIEKAITFLEAQNSSAALGKMIRESMTAQAWVDCPKPKRKEIKAGTCGVVAIAAAYGLEANAQHNLGYLQLGALIWADDPDGAKVIQAAIDNGIDKRKTRKRSTDGTFLESDDVVSERKAVVKTPKVLIAEKLVSTYHTELQQLARKVVKGDDCLDVLQEAIISFLETADNFGSDDIQDEALKLRLFAWFRTALAFRSMNLKRKKRERGLSVDESEHADQLVSVPALSSRVASARQELVVVRERLSEMPGARAEIIEAMLGGDSVAEIAKATGLVPSGVEAVREEFRRSLGLEDDS